MANIIVGKSLCDLCLKIITCNDLTKTFPHFLSKQHKYRLFSNGIFHKACFDAHEDNQDVEKLYKQWSNIWAGLPTNLVSQLEMDRWMKEAFKEF